LLPGKITMKMDAVTGTPRAGQRKISAVRILNELETHLVSRFLGF
jgi:hypothetical protein